jgi:predicted nucleic acid-binding protein
MAKVVIDSSVVVKWFVVEALSAEARRVLAGYQTGALELLAPDLLHVEFGNILWKKHLFQGMALADAELFLKGLRRYQIRLTPASTLLEDAFQLAAAHRRSVYDSLYVVLSVREGCPFVTADEKLANALGATFPNIIRLAHWP